MSVEDVYQLEGYEMHREIGSGGMARVFLATQTNLNREVAIKILRKDLAAGAEDFQQRFLHEGRMLASLVHPNIVAIHDINQTDEVSYMAMEYLKGGTLTDRIKEGLSVAEVIRITTQIAHALQLAHENNIVHRDLKPSNIMFRDELVPVLTDFGIARKTDAEHRMTKTGMVVGTPYYMSPEQITGRDIDGRSDIYSLGIMLYELLAGELPFNADEPLALAMQHVQEPPPPLPDEVKELQPVMDKLLAKKPEDRYQTMLAFCQGIKELVENDEVLQKKLTGETKLFDSDQFSDPRFGTGGIKTGGQTARRTRPEPSPATSVMGSGPQPSVEKKGMGWKVPAAIAAVLLVGLFTAYFVFFQSPEADLDDRERRIVQTLLTKANTALARGDYYGEGEETVVAYVEKVFSYVPNHPEGKRLAEEVAQIIEGEVFLDIDAGDLEEAQRKMAIALSVAPDYAPLQEQKAEIDAKLADRARRERIETLLAQSEQLEAAGQLIAPEGNNAYEAYQEILELDSANQRAGAGLQRIQEKLIADARGALDAGQLEEANRLAQRAAELFPNSSSIAAVRQDVNDVFRRQQEEAEIEQLLTTAEQQLAAEQYVFPPGDNALESFQRVLTLRRDNIAAQQGLSTIAQHFEQEARAAFDRGDFGLAAELASRGLRALPDNQQLLSLQSTATGRLDAKAREVEQELQAAERLALEGYFLSGPDGNARAAYQRVLELSPGNQRAEAALNRLPDQIYAAAQQLQRDGVFSAAANLLDEARAAYPDQQRFAELGRQVAQQLADQQRRLRLDQMLADAQRLVQVRPMTQSSFDQAAVALKEILTEYPSDVRVRTLLGELTSALADEADRISQQGNHEAAVRLIEHGLEQFDGNEALRTAENTIRERRDQAIAEAAARIAAMSGTLAIDAKPWGEVVEIRGEDGSVRELPPDSTTPMVISLVEGNYQVTVRDGNSGQPKKLDVNVERQKVVALRAEFDGMSAERYFQASGW